MKYANLIFLSYVAEIGGIETWLNNISILYKDLDITFLYESGSYLQLSRLSKNIRVIKYSTNEKYECENLFLNLSAHVLKNIKADKVYFVLHGNYGELIKTNFFSMKQIKSIVGAKIDSYISVSNVVAESWEKLTGFKSLVCYNPNIKPNNNKVIRICSAQRMTYEKGRDNIEKLGIALNRYCQVNDCKYIWDIYTSNKRGFVNNNIRLLNSRLDIADIYSAYDWFVSLSTSEAYCYSVVENLIKGIPCVVTDLPIFEELNLDNTNSIKLKRDLSNIDEVASKMFNTKLAFKYVPPKDDWRKYFSNKESTYDYKENEIMKHKVIALDTYEKLNVKDCQLDAVLPKGYEFTVDDDRLKVLLGDNNFKKAFVKEVANEPKEIVKTEKKEDKQDKQKNKK